MEGCAKAIVAKAKEAGLVMTGAGATFPYGKDPKTATFVLLRLIRHRKSWQLQLRLFVLSVKLVSIDKLLKIYKIVS